MKSDQLIFTFSVNKSSRKWQQEIQVSAITKQQPKLMHTNVTHQPHELMLIRSEWKMERNITVGQVDKWNISRENQLATTVLEKVLNVFLLFRCELHVVQLFRLMQKKIKWLRESNAKHWCVAPSAFVIKERP